MPHGGSGEALTKTATGECTLLVCNGVVCMFESGQTCQTQLPSLCAVPLRCAPNGMQEGPPLSESRKHQTSYHNDMEAGCV